MSKRAALNSLLNKIIQRPMKTLAQAKKEASRSYGVDERSKATSSSSVVSKDEEQQHSEIAIGSDPLRNTQSAANVANDSIKPETSLVRDKRPPKTIASRGRTNTKDEQDQTKNESSELTEAPDEGDEEPSKALPADQEPKTQPKHLHSSKHPHLPERPHVSQRRHL